MVNLNFKVDENIIMYKCLMKYFARKSKGRNSIIGEDVIQMIDSTMGEIPEEDKPMFFHNLIYGEENMEKFFGIKIPQELLEALQVFKRFATI